MPHTEATMDIWDVLKDAARAFPERPALVGESTRLCWSDVLPRVRRLAAFLGERGVEAGDRVAVLEWNSIPFFELTFAVAARRAVLMPLNVRLDGRSIAEVLRVGEARLLVAHPDFRELVREAEGLEASLDEVVWTRDEAPALSRAESTPWPDLDRGPSFSRPDGDEPNEPTSGDAVWSEDLCHLYFTSGTTGAPKGVLLSHANVGSHARAAVAELSIDARDVWGHFAPMFHLADAWATVAVTLAGGCHVFAPRFDARDAARVIDGEGVSLTNLVPTMLAQLTRFVSESGDFRGDSLRMLLSGGAPIAPELVRRLIEVFGCEYVQTYGMTETSPYLTLSLLDEELRAQPEEVRMRYRAKTGRPFRGVELRLVDEGGNDVPADGESVGEILARGASVTRGYWRNPEATREAFLDGWLRTGDLATLDPRGYFDIVDRKKDTIITGGENVYSTEVENVLYEHPAVLEAAVVGRADPKWGERVHAVVALAAGCEATEQELIAHCRDRLPGFKTPKSVEFLAQLPKTGSGKIHKRALRG